jgi:hypothetical protein
MRLLVEIDLTSADLASFDAYETAVLPLVALHCGAVEVRLRTADAAREVHLIRFPDAAAFAAFKSDPRRIAMADDWTASGAVSTVTEVTAL